MEIRASWEELKQFYQIGNVHLNAVLVSDKYYISASDSVFKLACVLVKTETSEGDLLDFETNFLPLANKPFGLKLAQTDSDTGGVSFSPKFAPDGWHQQYFETEFETSNIGSDSIHEKDWINSDIGFSTLKFYDVNETELTTQQDIDSSCVRTDLLWMPTFDYAIKSGWIAQKTVPASNVYVWALGVDLPPQYGGVQAVFAEGGINLTYVDSRVKAGLDGVAATVLRYSHPQLGAGVGTNRLRFVVRHAVGFRHRLQAVMEIFLP